MAEVRLNSAGMREMLKSGGVARHLEGRARRVAAAARAIAPVDDGDYRSSIGVSTQVGRTRVHVRVTADVRHAAVVEARDRVLGRALDAAGG